jgi:tRNA-2-methylthio-N6-dimethylallyladenosine synthase
VILLKTINSIKGIERIRFMTSHPKDASIELFMAMRDLDKVCEHLHLPVQSGSDRILGLMNRGYTSAGYLKLAENYRKMVPKGALTTDIVVGFPTETGKDFDKTVKLMKKIGFDSAFTFKYSPRPPAKSARLKDDVPEETKGRRLEELMNMQCAISEKRNKVFAGRIVDILVDGQNNREPGMLTGRTRSGKTAIFKGDKDLIGSLVNVRIISVTPYTLKGRIVR